MLEIKNVTKIYNTRGGAQNKALDGVSITFGETGLVFLLGKSGSGKSTLLNLAGGLDEPTSGEIIVRGKSSKTFSGSDFDSYRNTFVGFVFQEYNILDEFNVEDNIALALELQGKSKDREKIDAILRDVELESYAKRKPNTLSGGQKQRIAIARALVKDPQIIMADEPTGALDSATGKQVFDTLKKLSKTRLVIVVSHDREFAEIYGDRIVELKDGKIISDVSKQYIPPETLDGDVKILGGNTLYIRAGQKLTPRHMRQIQGFLDEADGDIIISKGKTEAENFKKANRMSESGETEKFEDTKPEDIRVLEYAPEQSAFIRSKLPASKAIRIGASGLKLKPVRLVFTILLSIIAFTMFGLFSTMMLYDGDQVMVKSFVESSYDYLNLQKTYRAEYSFDDMPDDVWTDFVDTKFTADELKKLSEEYGGDTFGYYKRDAQIMNAEGDDDNYTFFPYYNYSLQRFAVVPEGHPVRSALIGAYPAGKDEICISSYTFDCFKNGSFYNLALDGDGNVKPYTKADIVKVESERDVIGKLLYLPLDGGKTFKISGVFKTEDIPAKFDKLKTDADDYLLMYDLMNYMSDGLHMTALVADGFEEYLKEEKYRDPFHYSYNNISVYDMMSTSKVCEFEKLGLETMFFGGSQKTALADDEMLVNLSALYDTEILGEEFQQAFEQYYTEQSGEALERMRGLITGASAPDIKLSIDGMREFNMKLVGVFYTESADELMSLDGLCFSKGFIDDNLEVYTVTATVTTNYVDEGGIYDGIFLAFDNSANSIKSVLGFVGEEHILPNDVVYSLASSLYLSVTMANQTISVLSMVFMVAGIIFAVFSALLLFNFISMSISNKKKEIGILRAVGARGADVFKIFFSESGIIVGICTVLALAGSALLCALLNGILKAQLGLGVTLFVFGIYPILILVGIAVAVAFISTFLPVYFASRKKPVDSIRSL